MTVNLPVAENYTSPQGQFIGYDTINNIENAILANQKHVDIRGIVPSGLVFENQNTMLILNAETMAELNTQTMGQLDDAGYSLGDNWSLGTIGPQSSLNGINTLSIPCVSGINVTTSVLSPVDLTGFQPNDTISVAMPSFPGGTVNISGCYLTLSDGSQTQTFNFANSLYAISGSLSNAQAAFPYSELYVFDPTTVTIGIEAVASCTVQISALRVLSAEWTPLALDMNTQGQYLTPITDGFGNIPATDLYTAFRSDTPPGITDPRPINSDFGPVIYTGSRAYNNTVNVYFRQLNEAVITQLDLDYIVTGSGSVGYTQGMLDALGHQPDFGQSLYQPRDQAQLNTLTQAQLNQLEQYQLERLWDVTNESYIESQFSWSADGGFSVALTDFNPNNTYNFAFTGSGIQPYSYYFYETILEDNSATVNIYPVANDGTVEVNNLLFTTNEISNDWVFYRTAGRVGWGVTLGDGNAFIKSFNALSLMYAEYQSKVFNTVTPVQGASLTVSATPPINLYSGAEPYNNANLVINNTIATSPDGSLQVTATANEGIQTLPFISTEPKYLKINFDLYVPSSTYNIDIPHFLLMTDMGAIFEFFIGQIIPDRWNSLEIIPVVMVKQVASSFRFISTTISSAPLTWYMDNISITQSVISWSGRSAPQDPWSPNFAPWLDFGDVLNSTSDGIVFSPIGTSLQIRARAHAQNATISRIFVTPKYAQLGRVINFG
jgi:archaellin